MVLGRYLYISIISHKILRMKHQPNESTEYFEHGEDKPNSFSVSEEGIQNDYSHPYGENTKTEHVPLAPELIGHIGSFPVTNSLVFSLMITVFLSATAILCSKSISTIPGKFQGILEIIIEFVYNIGEELAHTRMKLFFPWLMTFFLYILAANLLALLPGVSTIGIYETVDGQRKFIPLLRSINSDLNMTLSLAVLSVVATHYYSIKFLGIGVYLKRWFSLKMFGVFLFVGILEIVAELTKIFSLSFRLFGNILAGKVLLKTAGSVSAFFVPLPFYFLEMIVAVVQAAVFMMLTLVFMAMLSEKPHH